MYTNDEDVIDAETTVLRRNDGTIRQIKVKTIHKSQSGKNNLIVVFSYSRGHAKIESIQSPSNKGGNNGISKKQLYGLGTVEDTVINIPEVESVENPLHWFADIFADAKELSLQNENEPTDYFEKLQNSGECIEDD